MHTPTYGPSSSTIHAPLAPLHRPWSAPLPGVRRASRVRRVGGTVALCIGAALLGASASWAVTAEAVPGPVPSVSVPQAVADPFCQFDIEPHRTVGVFGRDVQAWRVKVRGLGTVSVDVPNRAGRSWVGIGLPKGTAEDDVRTVQCKVGGVWRTAETA